MEQFNDDFDAIEQITQEEREDLQSELAHDGSQLLFVAVVAVITVCFIGFAVQTVTWLAHTYAGNPW